MWIKLSLILVPSALFVFLAQSVFWVPGNKEAADNDARQNRLIFSQGGDPKDMNPWTSAATTDSNISDYFNEGLLRFNNNYEIETWLSEYAVISHEMVAPVPGRMSFDEFKAWAEKEYGKGLVLFQLQKPPAQPAKDKPVEDGADPESPALPRYDIVTGNKLAADAETKAEDKLVEYTAPEMVKIAISAPAQPGKVISKVASDFAGELYKAGRAARFTPLGAATTEDLTEEVLARLEAAARVPSINHNPVVEMRVRPGVHWTDGPFFGDDPELLKKYPERFGDMDKGGPWWGKGPELMARDFKLTIELLKDPDFASPRRSSWMDVKEVRVFEDDPYKLQVVYGRLYSPAIANLTGSPLPYHTWNDAAWQEEAQRKGRGPKDLNIPVESYNVKLALSSMDRDYRHKPSSIGFMVLEPLNGKEVPLWKIGEVVTMRRNDFYWDRKPEYQFIDYRIFDPQMGRETDEFVFIAGGTDIYGADVHQAGRYKEMGDRYWLLERQGLRYEYIGLNCKSWPLDDRRVRVALSMAVDVGEIIKYVAYGQGERVSGPAYPILPWYNRNYRFKHTWHTGENKGKETAEEFIPYNLEEAAALLAEAGFKMEGGKLKKDGKAFRLRLVMSTGGGPRGDVQKLAVRQWEKLGIEVDVKEYEWNVYLGQYIKPSNFDVCVLGWFGGLSFDKRQLFHSKFTKAAGLNFVQYDNPKADKLMEEILGVYDLKEQIRMSHELYGI
ncbi:MAG: ABC transporter substrate-binding protein, partial [Nitrospira sp.]|nr:ABC transporter substrate-binding protein [Nitrospira sp.]